MIGLLDTHSLLWALIAPEKFSAKMRGIIADPTNEIHVSTISFWEISLKFSLGKLEMTGCTPDDLVAGARQMGLTLSAPSAEESAGFHRLPLRPDADMAVSAAALDVDQPRSRLRGVRTSGVAHDLVGRS